ncbi:MAG: hypothetical protein HOP19_20940 [Acidobacteria bacterium]|nr:hypothetical protein [Acidobacteriota bacterium]
MKNADEVAVFRVPEPPSKITTPGNEKVTTRNTPKITTRTHADKPPAIKGFKWAKKSAGFDCRAFTKKNGKPVENFVGYLGKKQLAEFRERAANRDELRELVREWAQAKLAEKERAE